MQQQFEKRVMAKSVDVCNTLLPPTTPFHCYGGLVSNHHTATKLLIFSLAGVGVGVKATFFKAL